MRVRTPCKWDGFERAGERGVGGVVVGRRETALRRIYEQVPDKQQTKSEELVRRLYKRMRRRRKRSDRTDGRMVVGIVNCQLECLAVRSPFTLELLWAEISTSPRHHCTGLESRLTRTSNPTPATPPQPISYRYSQYVVRAE